MSIGSADSAATNAIFPRRRAEARRFGIWAGCLFIAALIQFCLFLNHRDITTAHEGRVAATAREMLARHDWITPYCNNVPRVAKPPLPYWATMVAWLIAGEQTVWLARLPGALLGAIAMLLVMDLGRRILGQLGGIISGLVWISTWFIADEYRKAMADPYLAFFTLLSVWAWVVADEKAHRVARDTEQADGRAEHVPRLSSADALYLLCYVSAGVAALAKGHLILIHLACALIPYQILRRRSPGRRWAHVIGVVLLLAIGLPWPLYMLHHVSGTLADWRGDITASDATSGAKFTHVYHYLINLPLTAAPWTIFMVIGLLMPASRECKPAVVAIRAEVSNRWLALAARVGRLLGKYARDEVDDQINLRLWPIWWLGLTVLVFSLAPMKKNAYLDPVMPAQTLIIAAGILAVIRPIGAGGSAQDRFLVCAHAIAAGVGVCVVLYLVLALHRFAIPRGIAIGMPIGAAVIIFAIARFLRPPLLSLRTILWTAIGFALAVQGVEAWVIPASDNRRSDRSFAQLAARDAAAENAPLIVIGPGLREDVLFYLDRTAEVVPQWTQLPAKFKGYAIVTADQEPAVQGSRRARLVAHAANRPEKDMLYLFQITP